jgi:cell wall-associated NlpC family hydrolase
MKQIFFCILITLCTYAEQAIISKPVSDLYGNPYKSTAPLAYAQQRADGTLCPRLHQLLYHDVVEILQTDKDYSYVRVPDFWYQTHGATERNCCFWIRTDDLVHKNKLSPHDWCNLTGMHGSPPEAYITLIAPWYAHTLRTTFSVGTRFSLNTTTPHANYYSVYALHPNTLTVHTLRIPRKFAYEPTAHTLQERLAYYQQLISQWSRSAKIVPYVWGGCSMQHICHDTQYHAFHVGDNCIYRRTAEPVQKTGVDCAGLIMLAARTAGLPYPLKNTTTIVRNGAPTTAAALEVGDILWVPGHVMLIVDPHKGLLLEASHYTYGVGHVRMVHVSKLFKDIRSFTDIEQALAQKKSLQRLNRDGNVYQEIKQARFISMRKTIQKKF